MRTNIEIEDVLLKEAMESIGQRSKRARVVEALRQIVADYSDDLRGL